MWLALGPAKKPVTVSRLSPTELIPGDKDGVPRKTDVVKGTMVNGTLVNVVPVGNECPVAE
jgi:hypothetical protein